MRPWMVVALFVSLAPQAAAADGEGCAAWIRRVDATAAPQPAPGDDRQALYEIALHGERLPLDRYLGATAGGYLAFASSLDAGSLRAWFEPRTDSWIQTDSSGLVRTFGGRSEAKGTGPAAAPVWALTRVEDAGGNSVVIHCPPS